MKIVREHLNELKWEQSDHYSTLGIGGKALAKKHIIKRAKDLGLTNLIPDN